MHREYKAFTLVELIVVITVLGILSAVGFMSFVGYTKDSRDTVRISDLNSIDKALELSKIDFGDYPDPTDYDDAVNNWKQGKIGEELIQRFKGVSTVPVDPVSKEPMWYATTLDNKEYQLMYALESQANNSSSQVYAQGIYRSKIVGNYNNFYVVGKDKNYYSAPSLHSSGSVFFIDGESINFTSEPLLDQAGNNINTINIKSSYPDFTLSLIDQYENVTQFDDSIHTELKSLDRNDDIKLAEFAIKLLGHNPQNLETFIANNPGLSNPGEGSEPSDGSNPGGGSNPEEGESPVETTDPGESENPGGGSEPSDGSNPGGGSAICVDNQTPTDASFFEFDPSTGTITDLIRTNATMSNPNPVNVVDLVIPCEINNIAVEHIGDSAIRNKYIESLVLNNNIKTIGSRAFERNLIPELIIPSSVTSIGSYAFNGAELTQITIPANVIDLGANSFYRNDLTSITIKGNPTLGTSSFTQQSGNRNGQIVAPSSFCSSYYNSTYIDMVDFISCVE